MHRRIYRTTTTTSRKPVNRMYNGKRWLSSKSYIFITKQKSISIQSDYSDEAIDKIVSVIKRFRAALSQFSPRRMDDKDWLEYLRDFFSMQGRCALDLSFQDQKFGNYKMAGIAVLADPHIKSLRDKVRNNATSSPYAQRFNALVSPLCWSVPCYKIINNIISREDPVAIRKHLKTFTRNIAFLGKAPRRTLHRPKRWRGYRNGRKPPCISPFQCLPDLS